MCRCPECNKQIGDNDGAYMFYAFCKKTTYKTCSKECHSRMMGRCVNIDFNKGLCKASCKNETILRDM